MSPFLSPAIVSQSLEPPGLVVLELVCLMLVSLLPP